MSSLSWSTFHRVWDYFTFLSSSNISFSGDFHSEVVWKFYLDGKGGLSRTLMEYQTPASSSQWSNPPMSQLQIFNNIVRMNIKHYLSTWISLSCLVEWQQDKECDKLLYLQTTCQNIWKIFLPSNLHSSLSLSDENSLFWI